MLSGLFWKRDQSRTQKVIPLTPSEASNVISSGEDDEFVLVFPTEEETLNTPPPSNATKSLFPKPSATDSASEAPLVIVPPPNATILTPLSETESTFASADISAAAPTPIREATGAEDNGKKYKELKTEITIASPEPQQPAHSTETAPASTITPPAVPLHSTAKSIIPRFSTSPMTSPPSTITMSPILESLPTAEGIFDNNPRPSSSSKTSPQKQPTLAAFPFLRPSYKIKADNKPVPAPTPPKATVKTSRKWNFGCLFRCLEKSEHAYKGKTSPQPRNFTPLSL